MSQKYSKRLFSSDMFKLLSLLKMRKVGLREISHTTFHLHNLWSDISDILPSQLEMAELDNKTIQSGVSARELMERAGHAVFKIIKQQCVDAVPFIFAGAGNNGGDGIVIAQHLKREGIPHYVIVAASHHYSSEMLHQLNVYQEMGGEVFLYGSLDGASDLNFKYFDKSELTKLPHKKICCVDALLGTGQRSAPRGSIAQIISELIQPTSFSSYIAVDMPTGLNGDSGEIYQNVIKADLTICIQFVKRGLLQYPAKEYCGEIKTVDIGIKEGDTKFRLLQPRNLTPLPKRSIWGHKNQYGHVVVMAGSKNMPGAAVLASMSALRSGAGLVTKLQPNALMDNCPPEIMYLHLEDAGEGIFTSDMAGKISDFMAGKKVLLVGPGIGEAETTKECLLRVLSNLKNPAVIDASALNILAQMQEKLLFDENVVLTPHLGEAARLLDCEVSDIKNDPYLSAVSLAKKYGKPVVILKGAGTIICTGEKGWVSDIANAYLAVAGSGDVLSGIVAALMAQGLPAIEAAKLAVFKHGEAGERAHDKVGRIITASEIIDAIKVEGLE